MISATVNTHDFPFDLPCAFLPGWIAGELRKQGIVFREGLPLLGATSKQVETYLARPWRMRRGFDGTITVEQWPTRPAD